MPTINIIIDRADVEAEVAKATDLTGAKLQDGDTDARDRILTVDEDFLNIRRFWQEAADVCNQRFRDILVSGITTETTPPQYKAELEVSVAYDTALNGSVTSNIRSFFIASMIAQWFRYTNKGEAEEYANDAAAMLLAAERQLYTRRKPRRPNS